MKIQIKRATTIFTPLIISPLNLIYENFINDLILECPDIEVPSNLNAASFENFLLANENQLGEIFNVILNYGYGVAEEDYYSDSSNFEFNIVE